MFSFLDVAAPKHTGVSVRHNSDGDVFDIQKRHTSGTRWTSEGAARIEWWPHHWCCEDGNDTFRPESSSYCWQSLIFTPMKIWIEGGKIHDPKKKNEGKEQQQLNLNFPITLSCKMQQRCLVSGISV